MITEPIQVEARSHGVHAIFEFQREMVLRNSISFLRAIGIENLALARGTSLAWWLAKAMREGKTEGEYYVHEEEGENKVERRFRRKIPWDDLVINDVDVIVSEAVWPRLEEEIESQDRLRRHDALPSEDGMRSDKFMRVELEVAGRRNIRFDFMQNLSHWGADVKAEDAQRWEPTEHEKAVALRLGMDERGEGKGGTEIARETYVLNDGREMEVVELKLLTPKTLADSYEAQLAWLEKHAPQKKKKIEKVRRRFRLAKWLSSLDIAEVKDEVV